MSCFPIGVMRVKGGWLLLHKFTILESFYRVIIIQLYIESHLNECIVIFQRGNYTKNYTIDVN